MKLLALVLTLLSTQAHAQYNFWHASLTASSKGIPYTALLNFPQVGNTNQTQTDVCLQATATIKNVYGGNVSSSNSMTFPLTAGSGISLYSNNGCSTATSNLVVPAGSSQASFYFKYTATAVGSSNLTLNFGNYVTGKTVVNNLVFYRPSTCLDALNKNYMTVNNVQAATGIYTVDPDFTGAIAPFTVYCMMDTSPAYANINRGATLIATMRGNNAAINFVESMAAFPGAVSQTLTDAKYQSLLNQSSRVWFLSSTAAVNMYTLKSEMVNLNRNTSTATTRPVACASTAYKSAVSTGAHNMWAHHTNSGACDTNALTGLSFNNPGAYLYRASNPFFMWNLTGNSTFARTHIDTSPLIITSGDPGTLYIYVY